LRRECFLLCDSCGKKTNYTSKARSRCFYCKNVLDIPEGMEELVIALNNIGVLTFYSCGGHDDGFDTTKRDYPCVGITEESVELGKEIVRNYNRKKARNSDEEWKVDFQQTTLGYPLWLIAPVHKEKRSENLRREADRLAEYIFSKSLV